MYVSHQSTKTSEANILKLTSSRLVQKEAMVQELEQQVATLRVTLSNQSASQITMEADMIALRQQLVTSQDIVKNRDAQLQSTIGNLDDARTLIDSLEAKLREEETVRRRLHNMVLELKGNIRVFCRVRPLLRTYLLKKTNQKHTKRKKCHICDSMKMVKRLNCVT